MNLWQILRSQKRDQFSRVSAAGAPVLTTRGLAVIVFGLVALAAIFRANPNDIPEIVSTLVSSNVFSTTGWALSLVFFVGAIFAVILQRKINREELERVISERNCLQEWRLSGILCL